MSPHRAREDEQHVERAPEPFGHARVANCAHDERDVEVPAAHAHVRELVVRLARDDHVVDDDEHVPRYALLLEVLLLPEQPVDQAFVPGREEEARVPVGLEQLGQDRVAGGRADEGDHEVKPRRHQPEQVGGRDGLPLAPAAAQAEVEGDLGGDPCGVPFR